MHPLFDPAVLGATPCGRRLVYDAAAYARACWCVAAGWDPEEAQERVANMSTVH